MINCNRSASAQMNHFYENQKLELGAGAIFFTCAKLRGEYLLIQIPKSKKSN